MDVGLCCYLSLTVVRLQCSSLGEHRQHAKSVRSRDPGGATSGVEKVILFGEDHTLVVLWDTLQQHRR